MNKDPIHEQLSRVFREVFVLPDLVITRETTAADVPDWDSLKHIDLIVEVEDAFGIRFKSTALGSLHDVGALMDLVRAETGANP